MDEQKTIRRQKLAILGLLCALVALSTLKVR